MEIADLDIPLLHRVRARYLEASTDPLSVQKDYWTSRHELEQYDATFAQRIGWKWQNIIDELSDYFDSQTATEGALSSIGVSLPHGREGSGHTTGSFSAVKETDTFRILDFGCGTGIAARVWASLMPGAVDLWDRSALATQFAVEKCLEDGLTANALSKPPESFAGYFVLLSHLANEMKLPDLEKLAEQLRDCEGFCWVEPGTPRSSQWMVQLRKTLLADFEILAPCPHSQSCGLETPQPANWAWCHHFAKPPQEAFNTAFWKKFSDEMKIDMRSLPVSYLVMRRKAAVDTQETLPYRQLGRPRPQKGFTEIWICHQEGEDGKVDLHRVFKKNRADTVKRLARETFSVFLTEDEITN